MLTKFKENQRVERWKDTPFRTILAEDWVAPTVKESSAPVNAVLPENGVIIPLYNGVVSERWLDDKQLPDGLLLRSEGGLLELHIIEGATIERPIVIYHRTESDGTPIHVAATITLRADEGAKGSLLFVEEGEGRYLATPKVRLEIAQGANIEWTRASLNSDDAYSVIDFISKQAAESHLHLASYQSGGAIVRSDLRMEVAGEEAETKLDALNIGREQQHLAHVVDMAHQVPNCDSHQQIKNIIKDRAMALFDGEIHVYKDAQKIDADQMTRSLILDDGARTLTIPRLEIYADDVQCTHGATVGFIDSEHLFYLQTRGLDEVTARKLLMRAYGAEIVESIGNAAIQEWLLHQLDRDIESLV